MSLWGPCSFKPPHIAHTPSSEATQLNKKMPHAEMSTLVWEGYLSSSYIYVRGKRLFSLPAAVTEAHIDHVTKGYTKFEKSAKQ